LHSPICRRGENRSISPRCGELLEIEALPILSITRIQPERIAARIVATADEDQRALENRSRLSLFIISFSFTRRAIEREIARARHGAARGRVCTPLDREGRIKATMKIHSRQKRQAARDSLCFRESGEGCQFNSRHHFNVASWSV
jgi:hypothetical protein